MNRSHSEQVAKLVQEAQAWWSLSPGLPAGQYCPRARSKWGLCLPRGSPGEGGGCLPGGSILSTL